MYPQAHLVLIKYQKLTALTALRMPKAPGKNEKTNYLNFPRSAPFKNMRFCTEGAEKTFYVIAAQEPFAPKARRKMFF